MDNVVRHKASGNSSHEDQLEIEQLITRILKLSTSAQNPGMAYRNLETIHALAESLAKKLDVL